MKNRFNPGRVVMTPGVMEALENAKQSPLEFLARHLRGDWGELCEEDRLANEEALTAELQVLSAYRTAEATKIWIITESDRSSTTLLLPEEY